MNKNIYCDDEIINKAGADRTVISHVELLKINWSVFEKAMKASANIIYDEFTEGKRTCYLTEGGDVFHYMTIKDSEIGNLNFGSNPIRFGIMEFSPANKRGGLNLVNFAGNELKEFLNDTVATILYEKYGLVVSFENCTFKEMELNVTFALNHTFNEYYRPLSVLFSGMPYLKSQKKYESKENNDWNLSTHQKDNGQISVIAYNKSLEMKVKLKSDEKVLICDEDGVIIEADLMRIEFKLKTAEVCKKWFEGLNTIGELNDEMIGEAFERLVNYYFFSPLAKWEKENARHLNKIVEGCIKNGKKGYGWKTKLLTELKNEELKERKVILLALDDLNTIISQYSDKSGHKGRLQVSDDFSGLAREDIFLQKDREKLVEIVDNLKCFVHEESLPASMKPNGSDKK